MDGLRLSDEEEEEENPTVHIAEIRWLHSLSLGNCRICGGTMYWDKAAADRRRSASIHSLAEGKAILPLVNNKYLRVKTEWHIPTKPENGSSE